jgi:hypothetical protein
MDALQVLLLLTLLLLLMLNLLLLLLWRRCAIYQIMKTCVAQGFNPSGGWPKPGDKLTEACRYHSKDGMLSLRLLRQCQDVTSMLHHGSGGTLNTWRSGDDGRTVAERLQVRF